MCTFIGIESLAANALIELFERKRTREVSFDSLVRYGMEVVRIFQSETGEEAVLLLSRKYQMDMIENYSDFFEVEMDAAGNGTFRLKDVNNLEEVKAYFRWTMSMKLIDAFVSPDAIRELGVVA